MSPIVTESLAAVLSAPRSIEVRTVPAEPLPAAGAWLEVEACGICGSDWSWYAEREIPAPFVPGHEMVGRIVAAWGNHGNTAFQIGARVAIEEALPCWSCPECRGGRHRMCARSTRYGGTALDVAPALWGGFSTYTYLAPRTSAHAVPESLDAGLATLFIPVSNGLSWLRAAGRLQPGESVVVLGVGQHGLAAVAAARRCGAGTVAAVGKAGDQARLDAAAKLGADVILDADSGDWAAAVLDATGQRGADLLVDTTPGATDILETAARCAAIGGRVIVAGLKHGASSPLPTDVLVRREITVRGVAARESWAVDAALSWMASDPALFGAFSSVTVGLGDVEQALLALGGEAGGLRPVHAVVEPRRLAAAGPLQPSSRHARSRLGAAVTLGTAQNLAHATDEELRAALEQAELPSLMPALSYLTGDLSLVGSELRPPGSGPSVVLAAQGGMTPAQQELARQRALDALIAFRDGGCVPAPPPTRLADYRALMTFMTGHVDDRYLPMLAFELGLPADTDAPDWTKEAIAPRRNFRVAVIGAGMSGLAVAYRLLQAGIDFVVFERNEDVGGVWLENDYPGCRLDTSNFCYSYSFLQRDDWPHQYSRGPEIRAYFQDASARLGLREHIRFGARVRAARFDERAGEWLVTVDADGRGETGRFSAVISAAGQLNQPSIPDIPGAADFRGVSFHSARWDHGADLRGKRVGVIGSGASGFQVIPSIAGEVGEMRVFLRNPPWIVPTPNYHAAVNPGLAWLFLVVPHYHRWFRFYQFWTSVEGRRGFAAVDPAWRKPGSVSAKNDELRETLTRYLKAEYEGRPDLQRVMIPRHPPYGKRMLRDNGVWARTLKQPNVTVVSDQIERITPAGIVTADGTEHQLDVIVYCTGFQAWRFLGGIDVTGSGGADLHQRWGQDPAAYLGITIPDFPNLFCLYGPNTNLVVNGSIVMFSECAVHYVMECLRALLERGHQVMDLRPEVLDAYQATIDEANALMAWGAEGVDNWYKSPTGRVSQNWPLATIEYWDLTRAPDPAHYRFGAAG